MKAVLFGSSVARPGGQRDVTESSQRSRRAINPRHSAVLSHVTVTALLYSTSLILVPLSVQHYAKYQFIKIVCEFIRQTINTK